jgi:hypothetical protein
MLQNSGEVDSIQHYVIKFASDLRQVDGFLRVLWFLPPIKLITKIRYNWNIAESGVKQHNPNHNPRIPVKGHYFTFTLMKTLFGYVLLEEGFVRQLRYIDTTNDGSVNSTSDPLLVTILLEDNPL